MNASARNFCRTICQCALVVFVLSGVANSKTPVPAAVQSAKTVFIENQTGNEKVLAAACDQFTHWGRFAISKSKDEADLVIVFTHKVGMDRLGNVGITEMDVFVRGQMEPVLTAKNALKLLGDPQHPTKACIHDFRRRLEAKN